MGPNGQGRGSWFLAVVGSNPPPLGPKWDQSAQTCCEADFGSRIKILGHPLGQPASFFEIYLFRPVLGEGTRDQRQWDTRESHPALAAYPSLG